MIAKQNLYLAQPARRAAQQAASPDDSWENEIRDQQAHVGVDYLECGQ